MTEDLPSWHRREGPHPAAMTRELLEARDAGLVHMAIGRASDFFGAGVTDGSTLGERVFGNAVSGAGPTSSAIRSSSTPKLRARHRPGLATLGTDKRAVDQVWHLPGPETVTTRHIFELIGAEVGHPVDSRSVSKLVLRGLGLFNPVLRSMVEITYQFEQPFVLDTPSTKQCSVTPALHCRRPSPAPLPGSNAVLRAVRACQWRYSFRAP